MKYILEYNEFNDLTIEEQEIKDKAISDGTFMKAPNGKKSNLTEKQWLQVRTKNFINWFGDWINEPKNSSKMLDKNKEPMIVYHGSSSIFTSFNISDVGDFGNGIYFTSNKEEAFTYSNIDSDMTKNKNTKIYEVFLNLKNPYTPSNFQWKNYTFDSFYDEETDDFIDTRKILKTRGYDGIVIMASKITKKGLVYTKKINKENALEIIAFEPNQIKSATINNGDFDPNNKNINK